MDLGGFNHKWNEFLFKTSKNLSTYIKKLKERLESDNKLSQDVNLLK